MHLLKTTNRLRRQFPNSESKLGFMGYLFLGICFFSPSTLLGTEREKKSQRRWRDKCERQTTAVHFNLNRSLLLCYFSRVWFSRPLLSRFVNPENPCPKIYGAVSAAAARPTNGEEMGFLLGRCGKGKHIHSNILFSVRSTTHTINFPQMYCTPTWYLIINAWSLEPSLLRVACQKRERRRRLNL